MSRGRGDRKRTIRRVIASAPGRAAPAAAPEGLAAALLLGGRAGSGRSPLVEATCIAVAARPRPPGLLLLRSKDGRRQLLLLAEGGRRLQVRRCQSHVEDAVALPALAWNHLAALVKGLGWPPAKAVAVGEGRLLRELPPRFMSVPATINGDLERHRWMPRLQRGQMIVGKRMTPVAWPRVVAALFMHDGVRIIPGLAVEPR